ncbi:hypothetical protein K2173_012089 [Erythroxylum novogranatense]|uniref:Uncharacterized protein n=1 Tax=Erythroxylum novogranatense TaxID=1862640 RepID=A0AAV8TF20_9ROSI|nr:hypothetical protein K2173_012089 [Erythroxylum novogranatense]
MESYSCCSVVSQLIADAAFENFRLRARNRMYEEPVRVKSYQWFSRLGNLLLVKHRTIVWTTLYLGEKLQTSARVAAYNKDENG